ncbi:MAG: FlgD immunoglobulin-like domain containing protein [Calditrichaceae bacterium]
MKNLIKYLSCLIFTAISFYSVSYAQVSVHIDAECEVSVKDADLCISGDWNNEGDFSSEDSRLIFNGSDDQSVFQPSDQALDYLQVNKTSGLLILTDSLKISDSLSIVRGKISTTDDALLILLSSAECNDGDSISFVDGPMAKVYPISITSSEFTFPTGAKMDYRPVSISLASVADDSVTITVKQINQNAQDLSTNYVGVDKVSSVRYWQIRDDNVGKFTGAQITLSYDSTVTDDGVEIASELNIAQLDTSAAWVWNSIGGSGTADYKGTIQSIALSDFLSGYFAFGDATGGADISLPVLLSLFELSENKGEVSLNWRTESEINNRYWLIQKKEVAPEDSFIVDSEEINSDQYKTVARCEGQGTKSTETEYSYLDKDVTVGKQYTYRLVDVSINGRKHFHDAQSVLIELPARYELFQNYPNPFNPVTNITYQLPVNSDVQLSIYNILGQRMATLVNKRQEAGYYKLKWTGKNGSGVKLSSGMYVLVIQANFAKSKKLVILK